MPRDEDLGIGHRHWRHQCGVAMRRPRQVPDSFLQRIGRGNRRTQETVAICFVGLGGEDLFTQFTNALRYLALIQTARSGELSSKGSYDLFGAVAQQCLSVIASRKEFVSLGDLKRIFEKIRYLDKSTLESIINELIHLDYLQQDGIRKRYGPTDKLHKLVKAQRIYGNFPLKGAEVTLYDGDKELGYVPLFNLQKHGVGSRLTFRAKKWAIVKITPLVFPKIVEVEPYAGKDECVSFEYGGEGIVFETFLNQKMWEMIHEEEFSSDELADKDFRKRVMEARESVRRVCKIDQIPYCVFEYEDSKIYRYYTFAGKRVNRAIALITRQEKPRLDELWLDVQSRINWKKLPRNPEDYEPVFGNMFRKSDDQSIFQLMLPMELQIREYTQEWLKDDAVRQVLSRLASSDSVEVSLQNWPFA